MSEDIKQLILEHITIRIEQMEPGEVTDCHGLFDPQVWDSTSPLEHRYLFGRAVSTLAALGEIPLVRAGFNGERHNLFCKILT